MSTTITAANISILLTVEELYPSGVTIEKFSTDGMFDSDNTDIAVVRMSVDKKLAYGYVANPIPFKLKLEADSPSVEYLENIVKHQDINRTCYKCRLDISIPGIQKTYSLIDGILQNVPKLLSAEKVLKPTEWNFKFEDCDKSND